MNKTKKPFKNIIRQIKNGLEKPINDLESETEITSKKLKRLVNVFDVVGMNIHVVWIFIISTLQKKIKMFLGCLGMCTV